MQGTGVRPYIAKARGWGGKPRSAGSKLAGGSVCNERTHVRTLQEAPVCASELKTPAALPCTASVQGRPGCG